MPMSYLWHLMSITVKLQGSTASTSKTWTQGDMTSCFGQQCRPQPQRPFILIRRPIRISFPLRSSSLTGASSATTHHCMPIRWRSTWTGMRTSEWCRLEQESPHLRIRRSTTRKVSLRLIQFCHWQIKILSPRLKVWLPTSWCWICFNQIAKAKTFICGSIQIQMLKWMIRTLSRWKEMEIKCMKTIKKTLRKCSERLLIKKLAKRILDLD